jgi:acyl-CoA synthetase (AMP-forming)/AMP-acid ligase II/thioesterase domain-containing protein/acyl carrier protein
VIGDSIRSRFDSLARSVGAVAAILAPGRDPLRFAELPVHLLAIRDSLAEFGIGRGDRVASALPQGPETAVCYLGVASCATYAPLNPDYTEAEFRAYLTKLRPKAIILPHGSSGAARSSADLLGITVIELAVEIAKPAGSFSLLSPATGRASIRPEWNGAEDLALVLLTSGTTSEQKLVPMRQRHLLAYADAGAKHHGLGATDRCLHVMPMFHGHGLKATLMVPLASGSGVIFLRPFDIPSFFEQMRLLRPTWYSAAPSIHHAILNRIDEYRDIARKADLRFIHCGSGRLDPKVMVGLENAFGAPMIEGYSMSECCVLASNPLPPGVRKPGTAGKSMFNEVAVIDDAGNILGPGRDGEVVARGPGVFDGYLDNPAATAAAFINGWFRTGDLGRFDEEGYLTLVGRIKDVVNRGGEKIGTLEVEAALTRHPAVEQACVFSIPHPSLGEEVAAAVVLSSKAVVSERDIQAHARSMLTGFKVPRRVFFLPSFPRNATNKIRRDQVAQICRGLLAQSKPLGEAIAVPWSPLESEIAGLWRQVLGIDSGQIEREDDFFLIGGDSLKAYDLFAYLRKRYRVTVGLRHLFDEASTVAGMARLVEARLKDSAERDSDAAGLVPIKDDGERPPLFAVPGSGGNPVGFIHLARLLDSRQPLIGIESRGMNGSVAPLCRVEAIAADNLTRIRKIQPAGPYFLSGACYGAQVAYEMARQLEAAGERVGLLLMLDPSPPFYGPDGRRRSATGVRRRTVRRASVTRFIVDRAVLLAKKLAKLNGAQRRALIRQKLGVLRGMIEQRDLFRGDRSELHARAVYQANREAGSCYVPGPFAGPVVMCFTAQRAIGGERDYRLDWMQLIPQAGAPVYVSGKDSGDMLNLPHVYELADLVNRWLDEAHAKNRLVSPAEPVAVKVSHIRVRSVREWAG